MKVVELKEEIEKKGKEELTKLIVELYKIIPKNKKEDYDVDNMIINRIGENKKQGKNTNIDIEQLSREIDCFIKLAYQQCYFVPNKYISKKERPKWRFKVKNYYKTLHGNHSPLATKAIIDLYNLLSYGCYYYIFSSNDPYRSAGIVQTEMLDYLFKCVLYDGITVDNIKICIEVLINSNVDMETLHSSLINVFISNLVTNPSKEIAIKLLEQKKIELYSKTEADGRSYYNGKTYGTMEKINNICETILRLNLELCQYDVGINYFIKNYIERDEEIIYYILLEIIECYDLKDEWLNTYEKAMHKIEFRDKLQEKYKYIKKNNKFDN